MDKIQRIRHMSKGRKFQKGEIITPEGGAGSMFFLLLGQAELYRDFGKGAQVRSGSLEAGDFFGEDSLFLGKSNAITVVAASDSMALFLDRDSIRGFFADDPDSAVGIVTALCEKLEKANSTLDTLMKIPAVRHALTPKNAEEQPESPLFPDGHGTYDLDLEIYDNQYLYEKSYTCPQCGKKFKTYAVRASRLSAAGTDPDGRVRYNGVEPLYFDVISCPECWYSATGDLFETAQRKRGELDKKLEPYRDTLRLNTGDETTIDDVFASHYLALLCVPIFFSGGYMHSGRLWQKLARLYDDCGDANMKVYAAKQAYESFMNAYERTNIPERNIPPVLIAMGEMAVVVGDIVTARNLFFKVKTDKEAGAALKRHADDRIEQLREEL